MKSHLKISIICMMFCCAFFMVTAAVFGEDSNPVAQEDTRSGNQANDATAFEESSTPMEQQDVESVDQTDNATAFEGSSTPMERQDVESVDQINNDVDIK